MYASKDRGKCEKDTKRQNASNENTDYSKVSSRIYVYVGFIIINLIVSVGTIVS